MIKLKVSKNKIEVSAKCKKLGEAQSLIIASLTIPRDDVQKLERTFHIARNRCNKINDELDAYTSTLKMYKKSGNSLKEVKQKIGLLNTELRKNKSTLHRVEYLIANPEIKFYNEKSNTFYIGFLPRVKKLLKENKVKYKLIDKRKYPQIDVTKYKKYFNRKYQYKAVVEIFKKKHGIVKLPTGTGKTRIAKNFFRILLKNKVQGVYLFIVEQKDLLIQTKENFQDLKSEIGIIGDGHFQEEKITIATVQTLQSAARKYPKRVKKLLDKTSSIIIDECDMFSTSKRTDFIKKFRNFLYLISLSATPDSRFSKERSYRLKEISGDIIYGGNERKVESQGYLSEQKALFIENYNIKATQSSRMNWRQSYKELIVENEFRNKLIEQISVILNKKQIKHLLIVENIRHGILLKRALEDKLQTEVQFLSGKDSSYRRKEWIDKLNTGEVNFLIANKIFRRAVDIPEVQVVVNCAGFKKDSLVMQLKGRASRVKKKGVNKSLYIDFFDYGNKHIENHSIERLKTIEENKMEVNKIFIKDLKNYIKKYFRSKK